MKIQNKEKVKMNPRFDIIGDIAIIKFDKSESSKEKIRFAKEFLNKNKSIHTILEKADRIKGRLRIQKNKFLAGEKKEETYYTENGCKLKLNVNETYFSPRLQYQRQKMAQLMLKDLKSIKDKDKIINIIVMFAGVAPFPIVIAKTLKQTGRKFLIVSNELNRKASKYAEENIAINRMEENVVAIQCDAKKLPEKLKKAKLPLKYDIIFMARPNLKDTFLKSALTLSKKNTKIYYHGFGKRDEVQAELERDGKNKIGKIKLEEAGEIGPRIYRWLASFNVK